MEIRTQDPAPLTVQNGMTATDKAEKSAGIPRVAAADYQPDSERLSANTTVLDKPKSEMKLTKLQNLVAEMDLSFEILLLLLKSSREARENDKILRDSQQQAMITALGAQVDEIRTNAQLMIAMAIVSGITTGVSAATGITGAIKAGGQIKQLHGLTRKAETIRLKEIEATQNRIAVANTVTQSVSQLSQGGFSVAQKYSEARGKEHETSSAIAEKERQKAEEQVHYLQQLMAEIRELLKQITSNSAQAYGHAAAI